MVQLSDSEYGYKIGTAAKMAGISPNTLRTWMRRQYFTASQETDSGERLLTSQDLKRLINLKTLIDFGDSIGRIAKLDDSSLVERIEELKQTSQDGFTNEIPSLADLEAAFVYPSNSVRASNAEPLFLRSERFPSIAALADQVKAGSSHSIVIVDSPGRNLDEKIAVLNFARNNPAITVVMIFDFMPQATLKELAKENVHLLRWPINSIMLERALYSILPTIHHPRVRQSSIAEPPSRLFNDRQLLSLLDSTPNIECECPRHMSTVISSLCSFESYTQQCVVNSPQDRELHEFLHAETAKARRIMEVALIRLCNEDGIPIPPRD